MRALDEEALASARAAGLAGRELVPQRRVTRAVRLLDDAQPTDTRPPAPAGVAGDGRDGEPT